VVAVIGLHPGSGAAEVAAVLHARLSTRRTVVAPGVVGPDGLERAERSHERVLLVADGPDDGPEVAWREFCLRQADAVVLVARSDTLPPPGGLTPPPNRQPDVVLLGPAPAPAERVAWVAATDAWHLFLVDGDLPGGLRPLADRLAGRSLGLVLAGGGARAFAHIGVLRELEDAGLHVDRVAGSSIGAIIAAVHAGGRDGAALEEVCYAEWVRRKPFSDWRLPTHSLAGGRRVRTALARALGADTVLEGLPRQLHTVSTDLVSRSRQVHRRGSLVEAALASARLPVLFAPIPDDSGRLLVDGGVLDNLPVDLLTERDEGPVVAVNISMGGGNGSGRTRSGLPRVPALGETLLRTMMIGSGGAVSAAAARGATVVTPATMGVGLLEFHQLDQMVQAGREAARALLAQTGDDLSLLAPPPAAPEGIALPAAREQPAATR
jgi:predicted acylesterase/phospholipase RssA